LALLFLVQSKVSQESCVNCFSVDDCVTLDLDTAFELTGPASYTPGTSFEITLTQLNNRVITGFLLFAFSETLGQRVGSFTPPADTGFLSCPAQGSEGSQATLSQTSLLNWEGPQKITFTPPAGLDSGDLLFKGVGITVGNTWNDITPLRVLVPTSEPVAEPTANPTTEPTTEPTTQPTEVPSTVTQPTVAPTTVVQPTVAPTTVVQPTVAPTTVAQPTVAPTTAVQPSDAPTTLAQPTVASPTASQPSFAPSATKPPSATLGPASTGPSAEYLKCMDEHGCNSTDCSGIRRTYWDTYCKMQIILPMWAWIAILSVASVLVLIFLICCCICCCRKKETKEDEFGLLNSGVN